MDAELEEYVASAEGRVEVARLITWSEDIDKLLADRDRRLDDLSRRLADLEKRIPPAAA